MIASSAPARFGMPRFSRRLLPLLAVSLLLHVVALQWAAGNLHFGFAERSKAKTIAVNLPIPAAPASPPQASRQEPAPAQQLVRKRTARKTIPTEAPAVAPVPLASPAAPTPDTAMAALADEGNTPATPVAAETDAVADAQTVAPAAHRYAVDPPPSAELWYDVKQVQADGATRSGHGSIGWQRRNGAYAINGDVGVLFFSLLSFSSEGTLDEFGVSPVIYSEKRFRRPQTNTHFHRERNTISFSASDKSYPRLGGEQDRASILWQLAGIGRANADLFSHENEIEITVAGVRDAEPWIFKVIGHEEIGTGIGSMPAWHLMRRPRAGSYEQILDVWLAPQQQWYPVKLKFTETNGSVMEMILSDMQIKS